MKFLPLIALCGLLSQPLVGHAHGDEDHSADAAKTAPPAATQTAASSGERPQRLPNGTLFVPKPSQRQLGIRTQMTVVSQLPKTIELNGRVVMDPNASGRVQATQSGRLQPGARGLPVLGQTVRKGEVLALVTPTISPLERSGQQAQLAELRAQLPLAQKRLQRYRELEGTVPRKELEAAQAEVQSLTQRIAALSQGVNATERLLAPVSGVIASSSVVTGQIVEAQAVLFEVVDPARQLIEAQAYDMAVASSITSATLATTSTPLTFVGAGRALREGAIPLLFRGQGGGLNVALGQSVKLVVQTRQTLSGVPLPNAAVVRNAANEAIVYVHDTPETFRPVVVKTQAIDGERVAATGLQPAQRVVVVGATLLNQIR